MRVTFFLILTIFGCFAVAVDYYNDIYDNTNVDAIMKSDRLFKPYLACLLEKGSCTADGRALKNILPGAMATNCEKCNLKQKEIARYIGRYLMEHRPDAWALLCAKYDPGNIHADTFKKFLTSDDK